MKTNSAYSIYTVVWIETRTDISNGPDHSDRIDKAERTYIRRACTAVLTLLSLFNGCSSARSHHPSSEHRQHQPSSIIHRAIGSGVFSLAVLFWLFSSSNSFYFLLNFEIEVVCSYTCLASGVKSGQLEYGDFILLTSNTSSFARNPLR